MLAGVGLGEQQLEQRLVGRIDGLGQLPEAGADELPGGDVRQVAEVEHLFGADEAFAEQGPAVFVVAPFMAGGTSHHRGVRPPSQIALR